jgi:hypothetical protein
MLAELDNIVDTVISAVEIGRELFERNAELRPARQMEFLLRLTWRR